jgi:hypothetical protein
MILFCNLAKIIYRAVEKYETLNICRETVAGYAAIFFVYSLLSNAIDVINLLWYNATKLK